MRDEKQNVVIGSAITLFSWFSFALTSAIVKLTELHAFQVLLCQNLFSLFIITAICLSTKQKITIFKSNHYGLLFLRSMAGLATFFLIFISLHHLSVTDTTLLMNTGPFFVPFLLLLFYGEPVNHKLWLGIIPGFIGIMFILKPGSEIFHWSSVVALSSGLSVAVIIVVLRRLYLLGEPILRILLLLFLFASLVSLPFGIYYWQRPTHLQWLYLILIGAGSFISQTAITIAARYASAKVLSPLCYSSVVFALILDRLIWHILPGWLSIVGIVLVILGGIITVMIENRAVKR